MPLFFLYMEGSMDIQLKKLADITPYERNPRKNDEAVKYVAESIKQFGFKVPIVIDKDGIIVAGHTRYKAAKKLNLGEVPCIVADDLTDEQVKAFRLADNKVAEKAEWDFDLLDIELDDILEIDMESLGFEFEDENDEDETVAPEVEHGSLVDKFIVPPFSILDTRQGYWQDRKRAWKAIGIRSEASREDIQTFNNEAFNSDRYGGSFGTLSEVSIFDPCLCEIVYKWFNIDGGKIYDCFAGGSVRGVVAAKLGYDYTGIDLRQEQVDANYENAAEIGVAPVWYCDDSQNADKYVEDESVDLVFSCPPYADLEVYSDDPRDLSTMEYEQFVEVYRNIIATAVRKLKKDRFAVFVVGDVRDPKGFYRDFVGDTKRAFIENGCLLYNDMILVESIGTAAMRADRIFTSGRKVCKTHQNVLVFYKGDPKDIKNNYKEIEVADILEE
jgi:DNA modification methylase